MNESEYRTGRFARFEVHGFAVTVQGSGFEVQGFEFGAFSSGGIFQPPSPMGEGARRADEGAKLPTAGCHSEKICAICVICG
jgi:hypothetical protein